MESFGRYIAVFASITLLFVIPIQQGTNKLQRVRKMYVKELAYEFVEEAVQQGELTLQEWELLCKSVQECGAGCFFEISVGEKKDSGCQDALWRDGSYYQMTYYEEIKERLLKEEKYMLQNGDILMLKIRVAKERQYECIWQNV